MQSDVIDAPKVNTPASTARGSSFYTAMRIMPQRQRDAMYAIYAFCRAVDDIADSLEPAPARLEALKVWRQDINALYTGTVSPKVQDLADAVKHFGLRQDDLLAVIAGMEMDVRGPIQAPDFATLYFYCDRVACAVGRLCVRVMGLGEQDGVQLSHNLGLALQLTNILRDLDEDAAMNRLYLPVELLAEANIYSRTPAEVLAHPAIGQVCANLADEALTYFRMADDIMNRSDRKAVRTARVMSQAYQSFHTALVKRGFTTPRQPIKLNKARLGYILVRNLLF
jgi:phytoene synthase